MIIARHWLVLPYRNASAVHGNSRSNVTAKPNNTLACHGETCRARPN